MVGKALERKRLSDENLTLRSRIEERPALGTLIGVSRRMRTVFDLIERIGRTTSTVLITGAVSYTHLTLPTSDLV